MKIVHCLFTMETGGAQVLAVDLLNQLCKNHEVHLVVVNDIDNKTPLKQIDSKVQVHFINRRKGSRNPLPILKLNFLLMKLRPDVIHCHEQNMGQLLKVGAGKRLYTVHDVDIPVSLYGHYDRLVAISDTVYKDVAARYPHRLTTVYNGIRADSFVARKQYGLKGDEPIRLVQVSRLMQEKKGQDILLHALRRVIDKGGFSRFTLDFVGSGDSLDALMKLTRELGLEKQVNFLGDKDRTWLFNNLRQYHLLVQPSRYEGFGLTVLEGFAAGLIVIASDIEGPAEIIAQVPGGFLFRNGDVESCARMLDEVMEQYAGQQLAGLSGKIIPVVREKYSIESCTEGYLREYRALSGDSAQKKSSVVVHEYN